MDHRASGGLGRHVHVRDAENDDERTTAVARLREPFTEGADEHAIEVRLGDLRRAIADRRRFGDRR